MMHSMAMAAPIAAVADINLLLMRLGYGPAALHIPLHTGGALTHSGGHLFARPALDKLLQRSRAGIVPAALSPYYTAQQLQTLLHSLSVSAVEHNGSSGQARRNFDGLLASLGVSK